MTSLNITPNFDKKTARYEGTIAAGEMVHVIISDEGGYIQDNTSLRLRAVGPGGETVAQFPFNEGDLWNTSDGKIECNINLNTVQMLLAVPPASKMMILFVLDDAENNTLYFKSFAGVDHWPKKVGEDVPVDLKSLPGRIEQWEEQLSNMEVSAQDVDGGVLVTLWDGKGEKPASVFVHDGAKGEKGEKGDPLTWDDLTEEQKDSLKGDKGDPGEVTQAELEAAVKAEKDRAVVRENEIESKVNTLVGTDTGKSARTIAGEEVAKIVADAPEAYDTLKEIADWIVEDEAGAAALANRVSAVESGKVDKVDGKGLSTNDYTTAEKTKLAGIDEGAQKNPDLTPYALKSDIPDEVKVVAPDASAKVGQAADAKAAYDALGAKADKTDLDSYRTIADLAVYDFTDWQVTAVSEGEDIANYSIDKFTSEYQISYKNHICGVIDFAYGGTSFSVYTSVFDGEEEPRSVTVTCSRTKSKSEDSFALASETLPRYDFVDVPFTVSTTTDADGNEVTMRRVIVDPYTHAELKGVADAFEVEVGGSSGKVRDCALSVDCGGLETAPTITWSANFHPRTDAETDFACVAGAVNVYWITEYAEGQFAVAGWQVTEGGDA